MHHNLIVINQVFFNILLLAPLIAVVIACFTEFIKFLTPPPPPLEEGEGDSTNGDDTEPGDNHNYSQAVAHKLSALIVVLLFALNMNI